MATIYTKNGAAFVTQGGAIVLGDCCCTKKCRYILLDVNAGFASGSGWAAEGGSPMKLTISFGGHSTTAQLEYKSPDWTPGEAAVWAAPEECGDDLAGGQFLDWGAANIGVHDTGEVTLSVQWGGVMASGSTLVVTVLELGSRRRKLEGGVDRLVFNFTGSGTQAFRILED